MCRNQYIKQRKISYNYTMRTALITGASDGIGKAIALALSKQEEYLILFGSQREKVADS